jgi:SAM-dependent methyltransferase
MPDLSRSITDHYERHARHWDADRRLGAWHERAWHERFAAAVAPGGAVLDLGCGAAVPVAAHLVACGLLVTGVDSSPTMIDLCRARLPAQEWIVADMRGLAMGRRFAGILAWDSFFHLAHADQRAMFEVFSAHAAPGAVLMFNTGTDHGEAIGQYRGDSLYHASLDAAEYGALLASNGFAVEAHVIKAPNAGGRTVWLARRTLPPR